MKPLRPLLGRIYVVLVFVDGPGTAAVDQSARIEAFSECAAGQGVLGTLGASWGARQNPTITQPVSFALSGRHVQLTRDPRTLPARTGNRPLDWERIDKIWLDDVLTALGVPTGGTFDERMRKVAAGLAVTGWSWLNIDDVVPVFVTNYPTHWFAYADGYRRYATINVAQTWDEYPNHKHLVFAHELGHVFGAPDEYEDSTCTVAETAGPYDTPNANCAVLTRVPLVVPNPVSGPCVMNHNAAVACRSTESMWGWRDSDRDGYPDLAAEPTITTIEPRAASPRDFVTLVGRNMWDVVEVDFGGGAVTSDIRYVRLDGAVDTVESADPVQKYHLDRIEVLVPPGVDGMREVSVRARGGWSHSPSTDTWLLVSRPGPGPAPVLTEPLVLELSPTSGPIGQELWITGANLARTTGVTISGQPATLKDVLDNTHVLVEVPTTLSPGPADVLVTTPSGTSLPWPFSTFTVT